MTKADKLAAVLRKVKAGKRLTKAEEQLVSDSKESARFLPTMQAVAAVMGVTDKAVLKWAVVDTEGALEKKPEGYDIEAIRALRKKFLAQSDKTRLAPGDDTGGEPDATVLKARKLRLECEKLATQIDILRGKYALVDDVMAGLMPIVYAIKERFLKLAPEVSFQLSGMEPADIEDKIRTEVEKILNKLADEDIPRLGKLLGQPKDIGEEDGRLPAARSANGRQKAS